MDCLPTGSEATVMSGRAMGRFRLELACKGTQACGADVACERGRHDVREHHSRSIGAQGLARWREHGAAQLRAAIMAWRLERAELVLMLAMSEM